MSDFVIVLPTHSSYIGVVENFLQLLRKNWSDCPFEVIVSVTGEQTKLAGVETIYNGKDASLIDCLVNAANKHKSKYYISFLGDAFISEPVDGPRIMQILDTIAKNHIEYCSLQCVKNYKKLKKFDEYLRYTNNLDRYSHNFTAFVASRNYVTREMSKFKTDLEFEKSYLYQKDNYYYDDHLAVRENYFNLLPSITKGEWDRFNYRKLQRKNPEIEFAEKPIQSLKGSVLCHVRGAVVAFLPAWMRIGVKRATEKAFNTEFGVRD